MKTLPTITNHSITEAVVNGHEEEEIITFILPTVTETYKINC